MAIDKERARNSEKMNLAKVQWFCTGNSDDNICSSLNIIEVVKSKMIREGHVKRVAEMHSKP
jgi:hypothetical protein